MMQICAFGYGDQCEAKVTQVIINWLGRLQPLKHSFMERGLTVLSFRLLLIHK